MLTAAVLVLTVAVVALWWRNEHDLLHRRRRSTVIVTLKTGQAFRGVLTDVDRAGFVLKSAELLASADAGRVPIDGEVIVLRGDVEFMQRP